MGVASDFRAAIEQARAAGERIHTQASAELLEERRRRKRAENLLSEAQQEMKRLTTACELLGAELAKHARWLDGLAESVKRRPPSSSEILERIAVLRES